MTRTDKGNRKRLKHDAYQTPFSAIRPMLNYVYMDGVFRFLEPCRGSGNIYDMVELPAKQKVWCEISGGRDYLKTRFRKRFDLIMTNPPYSQWREFLEKSLTEADTVIYLLRLNCLGSGSKTKRAEFWNKNRPTHLFPLQKRPSFAHGGTDMTDYGWFVWDRGELIKTKEWITVL